MEFKDYADKIRPESKLDMILDEMNKGVEVHLTEIAQDMVKLDGLVPKLGLKNRHLSDIRSENHDVSAQR